MVPLLAGIAILAHRFLGVEFSSLGFYPTIIALTIYGIMPMLRNTVIGILGVDPAMTEAARGMGMTHGQILRKVELPLAAPVIIAGIRTATVWVVGTATLATPVGQRCLGNYIFSGLQTRNWIAVLFGCVSAAARGGRVRFLDRRPRTCRGRTAPRSRGGGRYNARVDLRVRPFCSRSGRLYAETPAREFGGRGRRGGAGGSEGECRRRRRASGPTIRIGSKAFTEQYILSGLIRWRLKRAGFHRPPDGKPGLGDRVRRLGE